MYADEDYYGEDLDEEDHAPHINLIRFGWGNGNKDVRYGDKVNKNLRNIKLKTSSQSKIFLKLV